MEVALRALHVNAAGLLGHAVVVAHPLHAGGRRHPGLELPGGHRLAGQLLPPAAVNQDAVGDVQPLPPLLQGADDVLPDHEGEAEEEDGLPLVLLQEGPHPVQIQLHVLVQGIAGPGAEDGKAQNARPPGGEHGAVAQNLPAVQHQEGQPPLPQEVGHDLAEGLLLTGGGGPVQENPGHPLPGGAGGGNGLEYLSLRDAPQLQFLEQGHRQHGGVLHRTVHVGGAAQGVQQAAVLRATLPVKLGQLGEQSGVKRPLLRPGRGIGLVLQQRVQLHTGFTPFL